VLHEALVDADPRALLHAVPVGCDVRLENPALL
jgi:hypothetical protein